VWCVVCDNVTVAECALKKPSRRVCVCVCVQCLGLGAVQQAECVFRSKSATHSHHVLGVHQRPWPGFASHRRRSLVTLAYLLRVCSFDLLLWLYVSHYQLLIWCVTNAVALVVQVSQQYQQQPFTAIMLVKPQLRTRGFCWSKALLSICPLWWHLAHSDWRRC